MNLAVECIAILFDMDGTLVDSTSVVERQWKQFAEQYRLDYAHIMRISHGRRNAETIREIAPHLATPEILAAFDAAELADQSGVRAVPGSSALLTQLAHHEWAVVTSASRALARDRMRSAGLLLPNILIGADDVEYGKPHPEGYLAAARRLRVEPRHCLVFEDTPAGLQAAAAAGMAAIGITTTYPASQLGGVHCVKDYLELALERLPGGPLRLSRSSRL